MLGREGGEKGESGSAKWEEERGRQTGNSRVRGRKGEMEGGRKQEGKKGNAFTPLVCFLCHYYYNNVIVMLETMTHWVNRNGLCS